MQPVNIQINPAPNYTPQQGLLSDPTHSVLADLLESRMSLDENPAAHRPLPKGINRDLRPGLPNAGRIAMALYMRSDKVKSYPLLYTTMALANPN